MNKYCNNIFITLKKVAKMKKQLDLNKLTNTLGGNVSCTQSCTYNDKGIQTCTTSCTKNW